MLLRDFKFSIILAVTTLVFAGVAAVGIRRYQESQPPDPRPISLLQEHAVIGGLRILRPGKYLLDLEFDNNLQLYQKLCAPQPALGSLSTSPRGRALSWRDGMLGVVVTPRVVPLANGSFAKCATQTARQDSAQRVGTRNGSSSAPGLPNECLASYIKYDLRSLTPNLSHFRAHLANPAIPDALFRGSLGSGRCIIPANTLNLQWRLSEGERVIAEGGLLGQGATLQYGLLESIELGTFQLPRTPSLTFSLWTNRSLAWLNEGYPRLRIWRDPSDRGSAHGQGTPATTNAFFAAFFFAFLLILVLPLEWTLRNKRNRSSISAR